MRSRTATIRAVIAALFITLFLVYTDEGGRGWENFRTLQAADIIAILMYWLVITFVFLGIWAGARSLVRLGARWSSPDKR